MVLVRFWCHVGVILVTFWCHFGTLGGSFGDPGPSQGTPEGAKSSLVTFWFAQRGPFGDQFSVIFVFFSLFLQDIF